VRLDSERSLLKRDSSVRFGDVLELTHPTPGTATQGALFRYAVDRRHQRADPVPAELGDDRGALGVDGAAGWPF
jgi:hypothetical protein